MLLRSSSASLVQTLFPDSPTREFESNHNKTVHPQAHENCSSKVSFNHGVHHLSPFSCHSSPAGFFTSGITNFSRKNCLRCNVIRRVQSDGNLEGLVSNSFDLDEAYDLKAQDRSPHEDHDKVLYSEPSFSVYDMNKGLEEYNEIRDSFDVEKLVNGDRELERSISIGDKIRTLNSGDFSFARNTMGLIEEDKNEDDDDEAERDERSGYPMLLVAGIGVNGNGAEGDAAKFAPTSFDDDGDVGEYYKKLLGDESSNPLLLRNYAQFLQSQGDLYGAEKYYFLATQADPKDGEILMQYAKLVWEFRHDRDKAMSYFERAVSVASEDSHVHAAYASFLWQLDISDEENSSQDAKIQIEEYASQAGLQDTVDLGEIERPVSPPLHLATGLGIDVAAFGSGIGALDYAAMYSADSGNIEDYHKRLVEENPRNSLLLRNYAEFLYKSRGDYRGAEEYYSRAILADPNDGEIISRYADLVWQRYHHKGKASSYFQRAIQATPGNCNVLAAYARFLWEAGEDEGDDIIQETCDCLSTFKGATPIASA